MTIDNNVDAPKIPKTFEERKSMYSKVIENRCHEANCKYDSKNIEKAAEDLANGKNPSYLESLQYDL